ncbi:Gfo/Idh/MocA family protein [Yinghuangia aomiensis]
MSSLPQGSRTARPPLGIGMVGHAFMGRVHSHAWRSVDAFFDLPLRPEMLVVAGRDPARVEAAAARLGWAEASTDWRELLDRDDIALIDICTQGSSHAEIAIAALEAGKHVLCEKPLANSPAEAEAMARAAAKAAGHGVLAMVGFNYRRVPALSLAGHSSPRAGSARSVMSAHATFRTGSSIRSTRWCGVSCASRPGSGALGDIGAHIIDLAEFLTGDHITGVSAITETFVRERPLGVAATGIGARAGGGQGYGHRYRHGDGRRCGHLSGPYHRRRTRDIRGHPVRQRPRERAQHRTQRLARQRGVRLRGHERAVVPRPRGIAGHRRVPPHPGHRARPPVHRRLVAARTRSSATNTASPTRPAT